MTPKEFETLLEKYLQNKCSAHEQALVEAWLEKLGEDKKIAILDQEKSIIHNRIKRQLQDHIKNTPNKPARKKDYTWPKYSLQIAAGLLLLVLSVYFFTLDFDKPTYPVSSNSNTPDTAIQIINPANFTRIVKLSDGSRVTLQPGSELRVLKSFRNTREVHLTGEGFFEIKRNINKPFLVYSNEIVTKVLGTSFYVKAYEADKQVTVIVKTGRVSVSNQSTGNNSNSSKEVILKPNQKAVYDRKEDRLVTSLTDNIESVQPLLTLNMQYKKEEVSNILRDLEKGYGVDIIFDEEIFKNCLLTTTLIHENFYERIKIICKAIGAEYEITDSGVVVKKSEPCN